MCYIIMAQYWSSLPRSEAELLLNKSHINTLNLVVSLSCFCSSYVVLNKETASTPDIAGVLNPLEVEHTHIRTQEEDVEMAVAVPFKDVHTNQVYISSLWISRQMELYEPSPAAYLATAAFASSTGI